MVVTNTWPPPPPPPKNPPAPPPATTNISTLMSSGIVKVYDVCPVKPVLSAVYMNAICLTNEEGVVFITLNVAGATTAAVRVVGTIDVGIDVLS